MRPCARPGCDRQAYGTDYACSECDGLLPEQLRNQLHIVRAKHLGWAEKALVEGQAQQRWATLEPGYQLDLTSPEPQEAA